MNTVREEFRLDVHQTAPLLGEIEVNERDIRRRTEESRTADLVVFPELSLTGYSLKNRVQRVAVAVDDQAPLTLPVDMPPLAFGLVERGKDELVYNTAVLQYQNRLIAHHRKVYLPTYGIFDEARYFSRGRKTPPVVDLPSGWRVGLLVCEDFWHPGLLYLLAMQGAELILVLSAAPGRGDPSGAQDDGGSAESLFASPASWFLLARTAAVQYGVFLVLANRAGVEGGLTFAGGSLVVDPSGEVLAEGPQGKPGTIQVALDRRALRTARTPFSHLRDEDPAYLARALGRLLEGEGWGR